ncbi:inactive pancreatic lipase-related protein 1-like [Rhodnius prolixus]|uniref:inactive pancreatic lipase-related protein 1-like n=1 Tax=Rhodnius prolixus TaxID=13249 RepID=UPI003D18F765
MVSEEVVANSNVCFLEVGCFSLSYPWNTLWGYLPQAPNIIGTRYFLSTRHNSERKELNLENLEEMKSFKPLAVIVHGFSASANMSWVRKLETALLKKEDTNVISVDWQKGATGPNYLQAIANLRIVGAQISSLLSQIRPTGDVHLIGQSLGAHLVSYVRVNMKTVSYITGLDPAQPWFTNKSPAVKLDRTDADFVDVIHTDSKLSWPQLGLGMAEPAGHVDFYINGGFSQPGCKRNEKGFMEFIGNHLSSAIHNVACSHMRASEYLIEALDSTCSFWGIKWNITESFPLPDAVHCTLENCQEMGKFTKLLPARGTFFVKTNNFPPYCGKYFPISMKIRQHIKNYLKKHI